MPVRSLKQSVSRWPAPSSCLRSCKPGRSSNLRFKLAAAERVRQLLSCTAAFGSYLDLILVDVEASGQQVERLQQRPLAELPFTCDALVLTPAELEQRLNESLRMAIELRRDLRSLL